MGNLTGKSIDEIAAERRARGGGSGGSSGGGGSGGGASPWRTSDELNRVAMSDVARDHGILPIRPDGDLSHAFDGHEPGNTNFSRKGVGGEFHSHRATLDARADNYAANSGQISEAKSAALAAKEGNFHVTNHHSHPNPVGNVWGSDGEKSLSSESAFGIVWDHALGKFRELTGFPKKKR